MVVVKSKEIVTFDEDELGPVYEFIDPSPLFREFALEIGHTLEEETGETILNRLTVPLGHAAVYNVEFEFEDKESENVFHDVSYKSEGLFVWPGGTARVHLVKTLPLSRAT